jgi:cell division protein FtsL
MYDHSSSHLSSIRLKKRRLIKKAGIIGFVLFLSAFGFVFVWQRVQVIKTGYEIEALKKERDALATTNKSLLIETATLTSPERVETIAKKDIGMRQPVDDQLVMVKRVDRGAGRVPAEPQRQVKRPGTGPGKT